MRTEIATHLNRFVITDKYRLGNFMCHTLGATPIDVKARAAIQHFMNEIVSRYANTSNTVSIALGSNLHRAVCNRLGMKSGRNTNYEQQGRDVARKCKLKSYGDYKDILHITAREIYKDWDNRFAHVEGLLKALEEAAAQ
jgi:hypothetical protein